MIVQQAASFSVPPGKFCVNISGEILVPLIHMKTLLHFVTLDVHMGIPQCMQVPKKRYLCCSRQDSANTIANIKIRSFSHCSQAASINHHKLGKLPGLSPSDITWGSKGDKREGSKGDERDRNKEKAVLPRNGIHY